MSVNSSFIVVSSSYGARSQFSYAFSNVEIKIYFMLALKVNIRIFELMKMHLKCSFKVFGKIFNTFFFGDFKPIYFFFFEKGNEQYVLWHCCILQQPIDGKFLIRAILKSSTRPATSTNLFITSTIFDN